MQDLPLPTHARVLLDAEVELRQGQRVPVLAQPSTQRLIVLNSNALGHLSVGQSIAVHVPDQEPMHVVVESIDRSSLIVRYGEGNLPPTIDASSDDQ